MNDKYFVQLPNSFWQDRNGMSGEMFSQIILLYSFLNIEKSYYHSSDTRNVTRITIDSIHEEMKLIRNVQGYRDKKRIAELVLKMKQLKWMDIDKESFEYQDILYISSDLITKEMGKDRPYTKIPSRIVEMCVNRQTGTCSPDLFVVMCYILKCSGYKNKISYAEFVEATGYSDKTCRTIVTRLSNSEMISVERGKYVVRDGVIRQEKNSYRVI